MGDFLPIRRSQLIAPFGVGAITTGKDGISLITAGLDAWFDEDDLNVDEFVISDEPRLAKRLNVDEFRKPPDFRSRKRFHSAENTNLKVPFLRFPQWHCCNSLTCGRLKKYSLIFKDNEPRCEELGCRGKMHQVRFMAVCELGHVQDFPWWEWVQETDNPKMEGKLYLKSSGGSGLSGLKIIWKRDEYEDVSRSLAGITREGSLLERIPGYRCSGTRPWLGEEAGTIDCNGQLRGALRSASNLHFAQVASALYLPPEGTEKILGEIYKKCESPELSMALSIWYEITDDDFMTPNNMPKQFRTAKTLEGYSDESICEVINKYFLNKENDCEKISSGELTEAEFRYAEFVRLSNKTQDLEDLKTIAKPASGYSLSNQMSKFSSIVLVEKLKETRAFNGFSRVTSKPVSSLEKRQQLWKYKQGNWLPAYQVFGEGIFFEFDNERISEWAKKKVVLNRVNKLKENFQIAQQNRNLEDKQITPQFVLIHTFAHLLLNQLTFECGYSSAALRERLYVSTREDIKMNAVLLYTASGDSEGSMGGLVSSGRPGYLEKVLERTLDNASWCSGDPICMDIGGLNGQGPDSLNLAACHNCALLPETACEEFNHFLDRGLVIGTHQNPDLGFFRNM